MLAILAAGQSRRFGDTDKLTAPLHGKMLGLHAAETLANTGFAQQAVITSSADHACAQRWRELGYTIMVNPRREHGQSTSVALAASEAASHGARALCICLADMPFVTGGHITRLISQYAARSGERIIASSHAGQPLPPAIFPKKYFQQLQRLKGGNGARSLLEMADLATAEAHILLDVDTPDELAALNRETR